MGDGSTVTDPSNAGATIHLTSTGGYTNDPVAEVDGTASGLDFPGVRTYDNGTANGLAGVYVDGGFGGSPGAYYGTWQSVVTLAAGDNVISAGQETGSAVSSDNTIDLVYVPTAPTITIDQAGGNTNEPVQTLSGTVSTAGFGAQFVAGTTLTLSDNGTVLGQATVGADGTWSSQVTLASQGANEVTVADTDLAGNTGENIGFFNLKTSVPAVAITGPGSTVNQSLQVISGTATAGDIGDRITVTEDGTAIGGAAVAADGTWSLLTTLSAGTHAFQATDADLFGNTGVSNTVDVLYVPTPPVVTIDQAGGRTNRATQTLSGTVSTAGVGAQFVAGTPLTLSDDGTVLGQATVGADGTWSSQVTLPSQGLNEVTVADTDIAGNTGENTRLFNLKTNVPAVAITGPGSTVDQAWQSISGTATAGDVGDKITVTEDGTTIGSAAVGVDGTWAVLTTLSAGTHAFQATDADPFGNTGVSNTVDVDYVPTIPIVPTAPTVPIVPTTPTAPAVTTAPTVTIAQAGGRTNAATHTLSGTVSTDGFGTQFVAGTTLTLSDDGTVVGQATVAADGTWSARVRLTRQGANEVTATDTDIAGNTGEAVTRFALNTQAPAVAITSTGGATNSPQQVISGTATVGGSGVAQVTVTEDGQAVGSTAVGSDGTWSLGTGLGADGDHQVQATVRDAYGNRATSGTVDYALKTSAPAVSIASPGGFTNAGTTTVSGSADAGTQVTVLDDGTAVGDAVAAQDGSWSAQVGLQDGSNALTASATDAYGNTGTSDTVTDVLSTAPPSVAFGAAPSLDGTVATLTGTASDAVGVSRVEIFEGGTDLGGAGVNADGTWTFQHDFGQGSYDQLTAVATDAAGNDAVASALYDLDTGVSGKRYTGEVVTKDADGTVTGVTTTAADGGIGSQTVSNPDGTATGTAYENGQALFSIGDDVMTGNGYREDFVFGPAMGHARITDFVVGGPGHDTLTLSHGDFANVAQVLAQTTTVGGAAVIHVSPDDTIRLAGVTAAQLAAHKADFAFTA